MIRVPNPGRAATLALLEEMVTLKSTRVPGQRHSNVVVQRRRSSASLVDLNRYPISGMGRAKVQYPGPWLLPKPPLCLPYTWPQCLLQNRDTLDQPPHSPQSDGSSSDSGPPSLELITDLKTPESDYEASNSVLE